MGLYRVHTPAGHIDCDLMKARELRSLYGFPYTRILDPLDLDECSTNTHYHDILQHHKREGG